MPGHENAGWVHEIGSAVTNVEVGDTVIVHPLVTCGLCRPCRAGDDMHCENRLVPGHQSATAASPIAAQDARARSSSSIRRCTRRTSPRWPTPGLTAFHAVKKAVPVLGAGHARRRHRRRRPRPHRHPVPEGDDTPTEIIVVDPSEPALALAGELGADHTVEVDGSHVDTVLEMTDGKGAEAIIDFVGEKGAIEDGVAMIQDGGFYYVIGYGENINVPTIDIISREIYFIGNLVGTYNDLQELMTLTAQGKVTLHTSTYPLDAVNDAMADLDKGRLQGRGILVAGRRGVGAGDGQDHPLQPRRPAPPAGRRRRARRHRQGDARARRAATSCSSG